MARPEGTCHSSRRTAVHRGHRPRLLLRARGLPCAARVSSSRPSSSPRLLDCDLPSESTHPTQSCQRRAEWAGAVLGFSATQPGPVCTVMFNTGRSGEEAVSGGCWASQAGRLHGAPTPVYLDGGQPTAPHGKKSAMETGLLVSLESTPEMLSATGKTAVLSKVTANMKPQC